MSAVYKRIALIGKPDAERITEILPPLYHRLCERGCEVVVERGCVHIIADAAAIDMEQIGLRCDLAIVVGGDGSLLTVARTLAEYRIPLIGVNLGRLGFLVDISPEHALAKIDEMLDGHYFSEQRYLLRARVIRNGETVHQQTAVNDVIVHSWSATSMIELETTINGAFLNSQRSDGLIVSTPTGSTAYALSGGGPILHPTLKAIVLVPINPHTLTNRPIVVSDDSVIDIAFRPSKQFRAQIACDNISIPDIELQDKIRITRDLSFSILHPNDYDFYEILRAKLNWSGGNRN